MAEDKKRKLHEIVSEDTAEKVSIIHKIMKQAAVDTFWHNETTKYSHMFDGVTFNNQDMSFQLDGETYTLDITKKRAPRTAASYDVVELRQKLSLHVFANGHLSRGSLHAWGKRSKILVRGSIGADQEMSLSTPDVKIKLVSTDQGVDNSAVIEECERDKITHVRGFFQAFLEDLREIKGNMFENDNIKFHNEPVFVDILGVPHVFKLMRKIRE